MKFAKTASVLAPVFMFAFILVLFERPVAAADKPFEPGVEINLSPLFGKNLPEDADKDTVDDGSFDVNFLLASDSAFGIMPVELRLGTSYEPELDADDPTSSLFVKATFGDKEIPLSYLFGFPARKNVAIPKTVRPFVSATYKRLYDGYLGKPDRNDYILTAGLRYRDVRSVMAARKAGEPVKGIYYELRAEVSRFWSNDPEKEKIRPKLRGDLYSHRMGRGIRVFGRAEGVSDYYDIPSASSVGKRVDKLLTGTVGVDLSEWVSGEKRDITFEIGVQFQRNRSNAPGLDYDRLYFAPSVTLVF